MTHQVPTSTTNLSDREGAILFSGRVSAMTLIVYAECRSAIDSMFGRALGTGPQRQSFEELHRKRSDPGGEASCLLGKLLRH